MKDMSMITSSLNDIQFVERVNFLQNICRDKRVLHLGATDSPLTKEALENATFLHLHLQKVSKKVVGLDMDQAMINYLSKNHNINNIHYGNIEKIEDYPPGEYDVVIAGEIFEHLNNPGNALSNIFKIATPSSKLIITVPNSYSLKGFCRALLKHELIHPDHVLHHSPHSIKVLLERYGFSVDSYFSFVNGGKGIPASIANFFLHYNPQLAEGIGVICSRNLTR